MPEPVPSNKNLFAGTILVNNDLFAGTPQLDTLYNLDPRDGFFGQKKITALYITFLARATVGTSLYVSLSQLVIQLVSQSVS